MMRDQDESRIARNLKEDGLLDLRLTDVTSAHKANILDLYPSRRRRIEHVWQSLPYPILRRLSGETEIREVSQCFEDGVMTSREHRARRRSRSPVTTDRKVISAFRRSRRCRAVWHHCECLQGKFRCEDENV
jgi:hypothetical protein